jgi:hypothetical protein
MEITQDKNMSMEIKAKGLRLMRNEGASEAATDEKKLGKVTDTKPQDDKVSISYEADRKNKLAKVDEVINFMNKYHFPEKLVKKLKDEMPDMPLEKLDVISYFYSKMGEVEETYMKLPFNNRNQYSVDVDRLLQKSSSIYEIRTSYEEMQKKWINK